MTWLRPNALRETWDKAGGYIWEIFDINKYSKRPDVEVYHEDSRCISLRQDNHSQVDLITLSHGQAYDLLKALARALETP